jgi:hypothetical protein
VPALNLIDGNWTAKLEHLRVGKVSGSCLTTNPAVGGVLSNNYSLPLIDEVLRVGLNCKFGSQVIAN